MIISGCSPFATRTSPTLVFFVICLHLSSIKRSHLDTLYFYSKKDLFSDGMEDCADEAVKEPESLVKSRTEADLKGEKVAAGESAPLVSERGVLAVLSLRHVAGPGGRRAVELVGQEDIIDYMAHSKVSSSSWWTMVWCGSRILESGGFVGAVAGSGGGPRDRGPGGGEDVQEGQGERGAEEGVLLALHSGHRERPGLLPPDHLVSWLPVYL